MTESQLTFDHAEDFLAELKSLHDYGITTPVTEQIGRYFYDSTVSSPLSQPKNSYYLTR